MSISRSLQLKCFSQSIGLLFYVKKFYSCSNSTNAVQEIKHFSVSLNLLTLNPNSSLNNTDMFTHEISHLLNQ